MTTGTLAAEKLLTVKIAGIIRDSIEIKNAIHEDVAIHNDILVGLSISGNSSNIIAAFEQAKKMDIITIGPTRASGGKMKQCSDFLLSVPSSDTPRIQEAHIMLGHIMCQLIEEIIYPT